MNVIQKNYAVLKFLKIGVKIINNQIIGFTSSQFGYIVDYLNYELIDKGIMLSN